MADLGSPHSKMQYGFHAGEWAPALNARVDLAKYHSAAALLENWYVDYRGGVSTRPGLEYIIQALISSSQVRLIPFQVTFTLSYVLEFGDGYIRFISNGSPVLEAATVITGATQANPCVIHDVAHGYSTGNVVFISAVGGMTQLNGRYFKITKTDADHYSLQDLNGVNINSAGYGAYTAGGTAQRVYTIPSPYAAAELSTLKYSQTTGVMQLTQTNHPPYTLTYTAPTNWLLVPTVIGASVEAPTSPAASSTLTAGSVNYAYVVTAVDSNGQESGPSAFAAIANLLDLRVSQGTNTITWTASQGAQYYNVYKAELVFSAVVDIGASFGYIGFATGTVFNDSNIDPNFDETPPISQDPFLGSGIASVDVTAAGAYTTYPSVTIDPPSIGQTATARAVLQVHGTPVLVASIGNWNVGDVAAAYSGSWTGTAAYGSLLLRVATVTAPGGDILTFQPITFPGSNPGNLTSTPPANPITVLSLGDLLSNATVNVAWGVGRVDIIDGGVGYTSVPAVAFSTGAATATAVLGPPSSGNPTVSTYHQQRLCYAGPAGNPQQFNMSKPGSYYNFDVTNPAQPDDAISGSLVSSQLNSIKALISMPSGLVMLADKQAWLINGGSAGAPISTIDITAQAQAYNGTNDIPPIIANYDILYVQSKGSKVRDLSYNFYTNVYTGTDISVLSSHLFFGFTLLEWAFAEEPFNTIWAVRNDGVALTLTFLKEQELIGWTHSVTTGNFKSVCAVTEQTPTGVVDATYFVVERVINGNTVKYIERLTDRIYPNGVEDAVCVDSCQIYDGAPTANFQGAEHLAGATVTGLADGVPITPFVMPVTGFFTLPAPASKVSVGLGYTCDLQTLQLEAGEPTIQGEEKAIANVTVRVVETLGLNIGTEIATLVPMKDFVIGNVGTQTNEIVTGLVTGDGETNIDPKWWSEGQYYIRQSLPYPATVLGVIPNFVVTNR